MSIDLYTNEKHYPPIFALEDYALDVSTVAHMKALDNNIARYAGGHSQSSYVVTTSGVTGTALTTSSSGHKYLATVGHRIPNTGSVVRVALLIGASAANKSTVHMYLHTPISYVTSDSQIVNVMNNCWEDYSITFDNTNKVWRIFELSTGSLPFFSICLFSVGDGSTSVTTTLYSSQVEVEDVINVGI